MTLGSLIGLTLEAFEKRDKERAHALFADLRAQLIGAVTRLVVAKVPMADADDVVAEAFIRLYRRMLTGEAIREIAGLIRDLARKSIADYYRKQSPVSETLERVDELALPGEDQQRTAFDFLVANDVLQRMDRDLAEILVLSEYAGFKLQEVADRLHLSLDQVKRRRAWALAQAADLAREEP